MTSWLTVAQAAARAEREARFMAETSSKDYMQMLLNSPMRPGAGSATLPAASLAGVLAERPQGMLFGSQCSNS